LFYSGYAGAGLLTDRRLFHEVSAAAPELIWVNQGEFLGPGVIRRLRGLGAPIINYANDNPFSTENWMRFTRYRAALPYYDLVVVVFEPIVKLAEQAGAKRVLRKFISADEIAHRPKLLTSEQRGRYSSDVAFVGTWMPVQRGPFVVELIRRGVPVSIWGDRWNKAPEWSQIRPFWRGPGVYNDDGYAAIIQSARICLGLVNKTSANLHTDRSIQIPALGGVLCAERTSEHIAMYEEGIEAVFWSTVAECATLCKQLLNDEPRRAELARCGHERALRNNLFNEQILLSILDALGK
jgi:spore maturation protein CgeB